MGKIIVGLLFILVGGFFLNREIKKLKLKAQKEGKPLGKIIAYDIVMGMFGLYTVVILFGVLIVIGDWLR